MTMLSRIKTEPILYGIVIVTEKVDGELYVLRAKEFSDLFDDWNGECEFVPANDAPVHFAAWNGEPVNPAEYHDFESLLMYLDE